MVIIIRLNIGVLAQRFVQLTVLSSIDPPHDASRRDGWRSDLASECGSSRMTKLRVWLSLSEAGVDDGLSGKSCTDSFAIHLSLMRQV